VVVANVETIINIMTGSRVWFGTLFEECFEESDMGKVCRNLFLNLEV